MTTRPLLPNFGVLIFGGYFPDPSHNPPYLVFGCPGEKTTPAGTCHRRHTSPMAQVTAGIDHPANSRSIRETASGKMPGEKTKTPLAFAFVLPQQITCGLGVGKRQRPPNLRPHLLLRRPCPLPSLPPEPPLPTPAPPTLNSNSGGRGRGSMGLRFRCAPRASGLASLKDKMRERLRAEASPGKEPGLAHSIKDKRQRLKE